MILSSIWGPIAAVVVFVVAGIVMVLAAFRSRL